MCCTGFCLIGESYCLWNKVVLEPRVSPAFAITFFCIHCNILDLKIHQSMWIHWPFFPKTWTKSHGPLYDLWPHVCWGHVCDSAQGSLCPSPMTIHQCMWIQWSILQNTTYIHIHTYAYIHTHTTYRMSDHIVSYWTQFRRDKKSLSTSVVSSTPSSCNPGSSYVTMLSTLAAGVALHWKLKLVSPTNVKLVKMVPILTNFTLIQQGLLACPTSFA